MTRHRIVLLTVTAALPLAGCGGASHPVCTVRPSADGKALVYSPPGCEKHLNGGTLNIQSNP